VFTNVEAPSSLTSTRPGVKPYYDLDHDYTVLRLKAQPNIVAADIGMADPSPIGKENEIVHYPKGVKLGFEN
jgi:hypothetical protein